MEKAYISRPWGWPVKEEVLEGFWFKRSPFHKEKLGSCVDFKVPFGTEVLAMEDGRVDYMYDDSNLGGESRSYYYLGNWMWIFHGVSGKNYNYSEYEHLACNSCIVKPEQEVKRGQLIARTGESGCLADLGAHLHVGRILWTGPGEEDFITLPIKWKNWEKLSEYCLDKKIEDG